MFFNPLPEIFIEPPPRELERVPRPVWFYEPGDDSPIFGTSDDEYEITTDFVGLEIEEVSVSDCHICIRFNYSLGYLQYPSSTICYIKPECQPEEESREYEYPGDPEDAIPPVPPDINLPPSLTGYYLIVRYSYLFNAEYSTLTNRINNYSQAAPDYVGAYRFYIAPGWKVFSRTTSRQAIPGGVILGPGTVVGGLGSTTQLWIAYPDADGWNEVPCPVPEVSDTWPEGTISDGGYTVYQAIDRQTNQPYQFTIGRQFYFSVQTEGAEFIRETLQRPPQPPNDEDSTMNCCPEILRRLRQIQNDLVILMRWTGAKPGQMQVPKTFMNKQGLTGNFIEGLISLFDNNQMTIDSLPEFFEWFVERQQEWMGEWPVKVTDSTGNELGAPNLAQTNQAILSKLIAEGELNELINAAVSKVLLETGLTRQNSALISSQLETIIEFLNIPITEKVIEMRHGFTMPIDVDVASMPEIDNDSVDTIQEFRAFLQDSTRNVKVMELANQSNNDLADLRFKVDKILALLSKTTISPSDNQQMIITKLSSDDESETIDTDWVDTVERQSGEITPWGNTVEKRPQLNLE